MRSTDELLKYVESVQRTGDVPTDDTTRRLEYVKQIASPRPTERSKETGQQRVQQDIAQAAERGALEAQADISLSKSWLPSVKAYAIETGADIVSPIARAVGAIGYADKMNRFADAVEKVQRGREEGGVVPDILQRSFRGAGRSLTSMGAATMVAGPYGAFGAAATQEANQAITEAKDAGLPPDKTLEYAAAQGLIEGSVGAIFQKVGLGGAEKVLGGRMAAAIGVTNALKQAGRATLEELPEEVITELGHNVARAMSTIDPKATTPGALARTTYETSVQTLMTMGMIGGGQVAGGYLSGRQQAILAASDSGKVPSRQQWKSLGLPPDQGKTAKDRAVGVQEAAAAIRTSQQTMEAKPAAEPSAAAVGAQVAQQESASKDAILSMPFIESLKSQVAETLTPQESLLTGESGTAPVGGRLSERQAGPTEAHDIASAFPEVEERTAKAEKGLTRKPILEQVQEGLEAAKEYATRAQVNIPDTPQFAAANETFRLLKVQPSLAHSDAVTAIGAVLNPLSQEDYKVFSRYLRLQNQLAAAEQGQPLRHGYTTIDQVRADLSKVQGVVDTLPTVQKAIENRRNMVREVVGASVASGLLPQSALDNADTYFHQQVMSYAAAKSKGLGAATLRRVKKSFQRARFAREGVETLDAQYDYNANYIQSEVEWMRDAMESVRRERLRDQLYAQYDQHDNVAAVAKAANIPLSVAAEKAGMALYFDRPGNVFYRAFTIPEKAAEQIQQGILDSADLSSEQIHEVLAMGGQRKPAVLPKEIVAELEGMQKPRPPGFIEKMNMATMRLWKVWVTVGPKAIIPFNIRNITGDADPALAAHPMIAAKLVAAESELRKSLWNPLSKVPDELRLANEYGVTASGFLTERIEDLGQELAFAHLESPKERVLHAATHPAQAYLSAVKPLVEYRENLMRYAAFKYYREQLASGKLANFGASKKPVIQALQKQFGNDAAAAKLARELIGDYGNKSAMGNWLSSHLMPFWSFVEINAVRYPKLVVNALDAGSKSQNKASAKILATAAMLRIGQLYAAQYAWNNLIAPMLWGGNGDDDLNESERASPHLVLNRRPDGTYFVFRNIGALGDALEWFGINDFAALYDKWKGGQVPNAELATEMMKSPFNKLFGQLRPDLKAVYEVTAGESRFPDFFNPRTIDRGEAAAATVGLTQEYKWMKGMFLQDGTKPAKGYWLRYIGAARIDPRQAALNEMYDLRTRYLRSRGSPEAGNYPISEYKSAREAAINEDYNSFVDWKSQFQKRHPTDSGARFVKFLRKLDPVAARLTDADEAAFTNQFLNTEQRKKLQLAREYSSELRDRLWVWWQAASQSGNVFVK